MAVCREPGPGGTSARNVPFINGTEWGRRAGQGQGSGAGGAGQEGIWPDSSAFCLFSQVTAILIPASRRSVCFPLSLTLTPSLSLTVTVTIIPSYGFPPSFSLSLSLSPAPSFPPSPSLHLSHSLSLLLARKLAAT